MEPRRRCCKVEHGLGHIRTMDRCPFQGKIFLRFVHTERRTAMRVGPCWLTRNLIMSVGLVGLEGIADPFLPARPFLLLPDMAPSGMLLRKIIPSGLLDQFPSHLVRQESTLTHAMSL